MNRVTQFGMGDYVGDITPHSTIFSDRPVRASWENVKRYFRVGFSFLVTLVNVSKTSRQRQITR